MTTILNESGLNNTLQRIHKLSPESKCLWGTMTVNEMLCHTSDLLRDVLGIRHTEPITPPEMRPQIFAMVMTEADWDINLPTLPPYLQAQDGGGTKPTNFEDDKQTLLDLVNKLYQTTPDYEFHPHAGLGILTREQLGQFIWKHTDHHLRQFGV